MEKRRLRLNRCTKKRRFWRWEETIHFYRVRPPPSPASPLLRVLAGRRECSPALLRSPAAATCARRQPPRRFECSPALPRSPAAATCARRPPSRRCENSSALPRSLASGRRERSPAGATCARRLPPRSPTPPLVLADRRSAPPRRPVCSPAVGVLARAASCEVSGSRERSRAGAACDRWLHRARAGLPLP